MKKLELLLGEQARERGAQTVLTSGAREVTYAELEELALGLVKDLDAMGVPDSSRVAVLAPNSIALVAAMFAVMMSGRVLVCLSPDASPTELRAMLVLSDVGAAVLARRHGERSYAEELAEALPDRCLWLDNPDEPSWSLSNDRSLIRSRDQSAAAFISFTSGSTGRPKGVIHSAETLVRAGQGYWDNVLNSTAGSLIATIPIYHAGGVALILLPAIIGGGQIALFEGFDPTAFLDVLSAREVDSVLAIPAMVELLFLRVPDRVKELSRLRVLALGGAPVRSELVRQCQEHTGVEVRVGYGLTEVPGLLIVSRADEQLDDLGPNIGRPIPGYEVMISGEDGQPVPPGELGELCIRTRYRMLGYLGGADASNSVVDAEGWLHTGDLARLSRDCVRMEGRKKEMYIRGGYNVYPAEVEAVLMQHPAVAMAAVHAVPDPILGERGYAWILTTGRTAVTAQDLRDYLLERLSYFKLPSDFRFTDELPFNVLGKIDKPSLLARLRQEGQVP
jgi:fatty-acyl-CoA synthase